MQQTIIRTLVIALSIVAGLPSVALAAYGDVGASCSVSVTTTRGTIDFEGTKNEVMIWADETLTIAWSGDNAVSAKDGLGKTIPVNGTASIKPPSAKKTFIYRFAGDEGKPATCAFTVFPIRGGLDTYSLTSTSETPTLRGSAVGLKQVVVVVKSDVFSEEEIYRSKPITVKNGQWSHKIGTSLSGGTYQVDVYATKNIDLGYIVSGTLTVSAGATPSVSFTQASQPPSRSISGGESAPVAYVRLTNTSKGLATINGLFVKRIGTANDKAVIGLGSTDDRGESNGGNGGIDGYTPFNKSHLATIPFNLTLKAGESRVITVTLGTSAMLAPYGGKTVGLEIYALHTGVKVTGKPITSTLLTLR